MSIDEKIMLQGLKVPLDASHDSMFQNSTVSNPNVPYHIHVTFNIHVRNNVGRVKRGPEAPLESELVLNTQNRSWSKYQQISICSFLF